MKWIFWVLSIALVLIGLDFLLGRNGDKLPMSDSPDACALYEEGIQNLFAFRFGQSIADFEQALELDPAFAEAGIGLATAYFRLGDKQEYEASVAMADSLTGLIADQERRMVAQLRLSSFDGSPTQAMRDSLLERLSSDVPNNIFVLEAQAVTADSHANTDEAEKIWRHILEIDPNYAASYNMLGYLELGRGNYDQAIEHLKKYEFLSPGMANPHDSLGDVLRLLGRYEEAEQEYRVALKIQPEFFYSLINIGRIYLARGQLEKGMGILEKVRTEVRGTRYERDIDGEILLANLDAGRTEELDQAMAEYIQRYPETTSSAFYRAVRLATRGDFRGSRAVMDSAMTEQRTAPAYADYPRVRLRTESRSLLYESLLADLRGTPQERVKAWRESVSFVGDKIPLFDQWYERQRLAQALYDAGRPDEALQELDVMLGVNPNLINALELAVRCNIVLERPEPARAFMDRLKWALARADADLPVVKRAPELEARVVKLEGSS